MSGVAVCGHFPATVLCIGRRLRCPAISFGGCKPGRVLRTGLPIRPFSEPCGSDCSQRFFTSSSAAGLPRRGPRRYASFVQPEGGLRERLFPSPSSARPCRRPAVSTAGLTKRVRTLPVHPSGLPFVASARLRRSLIGKRLARSSEGQMHGLDQPQKRFAHYR